MSGGARMAGLYVPSGDAMALGGVKLTRKTPNQRINVLRGAIAGRPCFILCGGKRLPSTASYFIGLFRIALANEKKQVRTRYMLNNFMIYNRNKAAVVMSIRQVKFLLDIGRDAA